MQWTVPKVYSLTSSFIGQFGFGITTANQTEVNGQKKSEDRNARPKFAKSSDFPLDRGRIALVSLGDQSTFFLFLRAGRGRMD